MSLRRHLAILAALCVLLGGLNGRAQTVLLYEGFEGNFPADNGWSVGDSNLLNGLVYWDDVYTTFGSVAAHTGAWKGYCAALSNGAPVAVAGYANNMQAYASKSFNFAGYTGANLGFWFNIPSIETPYDHFKVFMDTNVVLDTNGATPGWTYFTAPLNGYLNGTHTLKFEFDSDYSVTYEGAYLDDIEVDAATTPMISHLTNLFNANYTGLVVASDTLYGQRTIQAQAEVYVENFTGGPAWYTNVLRYQLLNTNGNTPQPIYDAGDATTNLNFTYNITNVVYLAAGTNATITNTAYILPAAGMSQFTEYYLNCEMFTNGTLAGSMVTAPQIYFDFTNTVSGDNSYNVLTYFGNNSWSRTYAVQTIPGQSTFELNASYFLLRWDDFNLPQTAANIPVIFNLTLQDSAGNNVPLLNNREVFYDSVTNYSELSPPYPTVVTPSHTLDIQPAAQLDSVTKTYYVTLTLGYTNDPVSGEIITAYSQGSSTNQLLDFDGNLSFGGIGTTITSLGAAPPVNPPSGGIIPTTLSSVGGDVTAKPDHTFAGAGPLSVSLQANGDAIVTAGTVTLTGPAPDTGNLADVNFQRGPVTLSTAGASGNLKVTLPTGFGYRLNDTSNLVVSAFVTYPGVSLTAALSPASDLTYAPGVPIYAVSDNKPVWFNVSQITWHVAAGSFDFPAVGATYVRQPEYAYLASVSNVLANPPVMAVKVSNDQYWLSLAGVAGTPNVQADPKGNAWLTTTFDFGPGNFRGHFPYNNPVQWTGTGQMKVVDDLVVVGSVSTLTGASTVSVPYDRNCTDCGSAGTAANGDPVIAPNGSLFNFTLDGGLIAVGPTLGTVNLQWGYIGGTNMDFAQQALLFSNAVFHLPGNFLRGDQNLLPPAQGATTILYTGFAGTNLSYAERPLSAGYSAGLADYAGMNFRCDRDSVHNASSVIAGTPNINWQLTGRSKYYVRPSGVTGIHEAASNSFPSSLTLWGYQFNFSNYGLSFIDSHNDRSPATSLVNGLITLPAPANFAQPFIDMDFTCRGAPEAGDVPNGDGFKVMQYWLADFKTHSITFASNDQCSPDDGKLVLGIEGYASHIPSKLYGEIGFFPGGDQIPAAFGLSNVVSRLKLPNVIYVDGPTNSSYTFTPGQDGYYNTWSNRDNASSAPGWMNIFGKMGVPFFEDLQLHLQTSCRTNGAAASNAVVYLSGGWPRPGSGNPDYGWDFSGVTPFETNLFDTANAGWAGPGGTPSISSIENYRDNPTDQNFHPRAQRLWLGIVDFDYPLEWNYPLRTFKSWAGVTNNLLIVSIQHQVTYMDCQHASLDFGAQYAGLPVANIANLAFNAIDQATGVSDAITKAATQPIEAALSTGLDEMDQLLDTQMKRMMDGVFDSTVNPVIDQFYSQLSNQWASSWSTLSLAQKQQFVPSVYSNGLSLLVGTGPGAAAHSLTSVLGQLGSGLQTANNLITQIQSYLRDGTNAINAVISVVNIGTNGQNLPGQGVAGLISPQPDGRSGIPKLITSLISDMAPRFIDSTAGPTMSNLVGEADSTFAELTQTLTDTEDALIKVSDGLTNAGDFTAELSNILASANSALSNVTMQVTLQTTQYFGKLNYNIDNPFQVISASDIKQYIRQQVEDQFFASAPAAQIQTALRQRLYDVDAAMRQQMDSVFSQIDGLIKDLIGQSLASLDDSISSCLGSVADVMGAGSLKGHADIDGDSLKLLRIDGHFQFKCPDNMELNAFLEIKELNSDSSDNGCGDAHNPFTEVTVGATKVPMDWISSGLTADLEAKFTFATQPVPIDLGGQISLNGDINFQAFDLHDLAVAMAFGASDNYVALKGGVRFNGFDFSGAAFFGKTCTLDPLKLIDPDVASVLGNPPFTGGYVYAQGWIPVSQLLTGIPATCLFEISAGVGAGAFYFEQGPTFGGKMFLGVSGSLLCIVSIEGDVTLIGVDKGGKVNFFGDAHFEASFGPCPFCISVSKSVSMAYVNNSWSIQ